MRLEEQSLERHEFVDGAMFALAEGTTRYNRISRKLYAKLLKALNMDCEVFIENVKLRFSDGTFYYLDVMLTCDPSDHTSSHCTAPCFLAEVLSENENNAMVDRGEKLLRYCTLSSLQTYALIAQDEMRLEVYRRMPDNSWRYDVLYGDDELEVLCVGARLRVSALYRGVLETTGS